MLCEMWRESCTEMFSAIRDFRQACIMSPDLFNAYVNDMKIINID